jgi:adenine deaminase
MLNIARGVEKAELVIKNANIINVFTNEVIKGDVAIDGGIIVAIGQYSGKEEVDLKGKYLSPAFIDSHVHIESSKVTPGQFAKAVVPRGVTTIIADPHEIANVKGIEGIEYMLDESENIPLDVYIMLPSCVPATPFESAGAVLEAGDLERVIDRERVLGMGEMMDYVGVVNGDEELLKKIELARKKGKIIDGHGPMITGKELNAYVAAGIKTEHECSTVKEMVERLRLGMYIHIREGSAARNLKELIKAVNKDNLSRIMFCTDDKEPSDLLINGSIDNNIRLAIREGIDPIDCIKIASLNPAQAYGLEGKGAIAPGYRADLVVIDNLMDFNVLMVFKEGKLVAENYMPLFHVPESTNTSMKNTVVIKDIKEEDLRLNIPGDKVNVIKIIPDSLITEKVLREVGKDITVENGEFIKGKDILKVAVIERHKATGRIGLALVEGFGLENGAIASTIAHDSHNIIAIGDRDSDMILAVEELKRLGGGIALAQEGKIIGALQLEIAGLMSDKPLEEVKKGLDEIFNMAYDRLKVNRNIEPFMILSFLALPVIPSLKVTDLGLFDVDEFKFINIDANDGKAYGLS